MEHAEQIALSRRLCIKRKKAVRGDWRLTEVESSRKKGIPRTGDAQTGNGTKRAAERCCCYCRGGTRDSGVSSTRKRKDGRKEARASLLRNRKCYKEALLSISLEEARPLLLTSFFFVILRGSSSARRSPFAFIFPIIPCVLPKYSLFLPTQTPPSSSPSSLPSFKKRGGDQSITARAGHCMAKNKRRKKQRCRVPLFPAAGLIVTAGIGGEGLEIQRDSTDAPYCQ
ncbi:hypothetical protein HPB50_012998 [Hyalomma asiaticum]|uniref:Uncharacterized protein n=1 Tax=Hyalomma asiaticum TaxID=266040 RepID=A0ACB7S9J9_HYAAI|nr:hypothetical protein HPB50_012998 [Hyalomma asiaticum]